LGSIVIGRPRPGAFEAVCTAVASVDIRVLDVIIEGVLDIFRLASTHCFSRSPSQRIISRVALFASISTFAVLAKIGLVLATHFVSIRVSLRSSLPYHVSAMSIVRVLLALVLIRPSPAALSL